MHYAHKYLLYKIPQLNAHCNKYLQFNNNDNLYILQNLSYTTINGGAFMARKKESETLRQRKFAQQEFLKLKKMQNGEIEAGPKPSEMAAPLTFGEKIKNIWYHDKFVIIIIAILVIAIAALSVQCATKTKYDATVVVFTYKPTGDPNCDKMGEYIRPYCTDINGDGKININVINLTINGYEDNEYSYSNRTQLSSIIANDASALLFITDEDSYKYLAEEISDNIEFFEGEPIKFADDFYDFCIDESGFYQTPYGLQISCRNIKGAAIEKDKKIDEYYNQAQGVLSGLRAAYAN